MYCTNCGEKIESGDNFCIKCGTPVTLDNQQMNSQNSQTLTKESIEANKQRNDNSVLINPKDPSKEEMSADDKRAANILCIFSLLFGFGDYFLIPILQYMNENLGFMGIISTSPLAGLALMIVARVKYPKSTFAKVVMWIYIVNIVLAIIGIILLLLTCGTMISSCRGMG